MLILLSPESPDREYHSHPPTPGMVQAYRLLLAEVDTAPSLVEQDRNWLERVAAFFFLGECMAAVALCLVLIGCATETRSSDDTRVVTEQGS
jgi:hypothetical protein